MTDTGFWLVFFGLLDFGTKNLTDGSSRFWISGLILLSINFWYKTNTVEDAGQWQFCSIFFVDGRYKDFVELRARHKKRLHRNAAPF